MTNLKTKPARFLVVPSVDGESKKIDLYGDVRYNTTLWGSDSQSNFIDVISMGPISGITDLSLDDTPYSLEEFPGSKFFSHDGDGPENPWSGESYFPFVERSYTVGKQAENKGGPDGQDLEETTFVKSVSGIGVVGIRLNFTTSTFTHRDDKNREKHARAVFTVELLDEDGLPVSGYKNTKQVDAWAANQTMVSLNLTPPSAWSDRAWSYRVTMGIRCNYWHTSVAGSWSCSTVTELYRETQTYENIAYVSGQIIAQDVSGKIPKRVYLIDGYKVNVPVYQEVMGTLVPTGEFKRETSESHAWNAMSVITDTLAFAGQPMDKINLSSFLEFEKHCSKVIDGVRNFSCSQHIIKATNYFKLASQIVGAADGKLYEDSSGRIGVLIDKKEDKRRILTSYDIVGEEVQRTTVPASKRINYVSAEFDDKTNNYTTQILHVENIAAQLNDGIVSKALKLETCTEPKEATRVLRKFLAVSQYLTTTFGLTVGHSNEDIQIGEIVEIYDRNYSRANYCGKTASGSTSHLIQIDRNTPIDLTNISFPEIAFDLGNGKGVQRHSITGWTPTSVTLNVDITDIPVEFTSFGIRSMNETTGVQPSLARVLKITDDKKGYTLECISYNHTIQDHVDYGSPVRIPIERVIPAKSTENINNVNISKTTTGLLATWDKTTRDSYVYQWKYEGKFYSNGVIEDNSTTLPFPLKFGYYELSVAEKFEGISGEFSTASYLLTEEGDGTSPTLAVPSNVGVRIGDITSNLYTGRGFNIGWDYAINPHSFKVRLIQGTSKSEVLISGDAREYYFSDSQLNTLFGEDRDRAFTVNVLAIDNLTKVSESGAASINNPPPPNVTVEVTDTGDVVVTNSTSGDATGTVAYIWAMSINDSEARPSNAYRVETGSIFNLSVPSAAIPVEGIKYIYEVLWLDDFGERGTSVVRVVYTHLLMIHVPTPPELTSVIPLTSQSVLVNFTHDGTYLDHLQGEFRQLGSDTWTQVASVYSLPIPTDPPTPSSSSYDPASETGNWIVTGLDKNFEYEFRARVANVNSGYSDYSNTVNGNAYLDILLDFDFEEEISDVRDLIAEGVTDVFNNLGETIDNIRDAKETVLLKKSVQELKIEDANITQALLVVSNETEAQATSIVEMTAAIGENVARNNVLSEAIATETEARARVVEGLQTEVGENRSQIVVVSEALTSETEARATQASELIASIEENLAKITSASEAITTETEARISQFESLSASVGENSSLISIANQAIATETEARATQYNAISSTVNGNSSSISNNSQTISNEISTRSSQYNSLSSSIGSNSSAIATVDDNAKTAIGYCKISGNNSAHPTKALCNAAGGLWTNTPFATAVLNVAVSYAGNTLSVGSFYESYIDLYGDLHGKAVLGVDAAGSFTGVEIIGGSNYSQLTFKGDKVVFKDTSGNTRLYYDTGSNKWVFNGTIYAENIIGDTAAGAFKFLSSRYWDDAAPNEISVASGYVAAAPYTRRVLLPCPVITSNDGLESKATVSFYKDGSLFWTDSTLRGSGTYSGGPQSFLLTANASASFEVRVSWRAGKINLLPQGYRVDVFRTSDQIVFT